MDIARNLGSRNWLSGVLVLQARQMSTAVRGRRRYASDGQVNILRFLVMDRCIHMCLQYYSIRIRRDEESCFLTRTRFT